MRSVVAVFFVTVSLIFSMFLATACNNRHPEYPYSVSLGEAGEILEASLPVPAYLPDGYEIKDIYVTEEADDSEHMLVLISDEPIKENELSSKINLYIALHKTGIVPLKPIGEPLDINGHDGFLVHRETTNDIRWISPYPDSSGQYEIRLSATIEIPEKELIKIARSISTDTS